MIRKFIAVLALVGLCSAAHAASINVLWYT